MLRSQFRQHPSVVRRDRRKYVAQMMGRGVPEAVIIDVFAPSLAGEIKRYIQKNRGSRYGDQPSTKR
mgnify:CR=1 FL=1